MVSRGYLELIIGPMFSGKTSRILEIYRKAKYCNSNIFVLNHSLDTRHGTNKLVNHNSEGVPCLNYTTIQQFIDEHVSTGYGDAEQYTETVVLINEGQFFSDVKKGVIALTEQFKFKVYVCGLDGDYTRSAFGEFLNLIPYSDKIVKLNALCVRCRNGTDAPFTYRCCENDNQIMIGAAESYIPVCRECYVEMSTRDSR